MRRRLFGDEQRGVVSQTEMAHGRSAEQLHERGVRVEAEQVALSERAAGVAAEGAARTAHGSSDLAAARASLRHARDQHRVCIDEQRRFRVRLLQLAAEQGHAGHVRRDEDVLALGRARDLDLFQRAQRARRVHMRQARPHGFGGKLASAAHIAVQLDGGGRDRRRGAGGGGVGRGRGRVHHGSGCRVDCGCWDCGCNLAVGCCCCRRVIMMMIGRSIVIVIGWVSVMSSLTVIGRMLLLLLLHGGRLRLIGHSRQMVAAEGSDREAQRRQRRISAGASGAQLMAVQSDISLGHSACICNKGARRLVCALLVHCWR